MDLDAGRGEGVVSAVRAYNGGPLVVGSGAKAPLKLKAFLQLVAVFLVEFCTFFEYFYHVYLLLQRGLLPYCPRHMTGMEAISRIRLSKHMVIDMEDLVNHIHIHG